MRVNLGTIDISDKARKAITRHLTDGRRGSLAGRAEVKEIFQKAGKKAIKKMVKEWSGSD